MHGSNKTLIPAILMLAGLPLSASGQLIPFGKSAPVERDATPHVDLKVVADAEAIPAGGSVTLGFAFTIDDEWHIYWKNSGVSGLPPRVQWELPEGFSAAPFQHPTPKRYPVPPIGDTYIHDGSPVLLTRITAPTDAAVGGEVEIKGTATWLVCQKACLPGEQAFTVTLPVVAAGTQPKAANADLFTAARRALPLAADKAKYAKVSAKLSVDRVRPDDKFEVAVVLDVKEHYHVQSNKPLIEGLIPTEVFPAPSEGLEASDAIFPKHKVRASPIGQLAEFDGHVVIRIPMLADTELEGDAGEISGVVRFQACDDKGACFPPESVAWSVKVPYAKAGEKVSQIDLFATPALTAAAAPPTGSDGAVTAGFDIDGEINVQESGAEHPLWWYIIMALAGGLFLNITPCVLPVISIKILSFVQQAGEDSRRVTMLNLAFSAGLLSVFLILATLARFFGYGWGELFTYVSFNIVLATVVFAMGLSFFGVFEIPVPGWASRAGGVEREGLPGAFMKGILATLLATPCAGPLMGAVLAWSVAQPAAITYIVWLSIGVGMASPYLLAAVNPSVLRWLPKPGLWMERVKQFMGFLLMGTTVYFLYVLPDAYVIWSAAFLVVVGTACWMLGQLVNINSTPSRKVVVRGGAAVLVTAMGLLAFDRMIPAAEADEQAKLGFLIQDARRVGYEQGVAAAAGSSVDTEPLIKLVERIQSAMAGSGSVKPPLFAIGGPKWSSSGSADLAPLIDELQTAIAALSAGDAAPPNPRNDPPAPAANPGNKTHLPWRPFSLDRLAELTKQGRTVLVDFTADWCPNCKLNEAIALNTAETKALVDKNGVECLLADYTRQSPEIKKLLNKLGSISVPLTAIFPADRPNEPIVLQDIFTKATLLEKLREAGPSLQPVAQAQIGTKTGG